MGSLYVLIEATTFFSPIFSLFKIWRELRARFGGLCSNDVQDLGHLACYCYNEYQDCQFTVFERNVGNNIPVTEPNSPVERNPLISTLQTDPKCLLRACLFSTPAFEWFIGFPACLFFIFFTDELYTQTF